MTKKSLKSSDLNNGKTLVLGSVYRHPNNVIKNFEDAFISVVKSFKSNQNYIVMGDFNINYVVSQIRKKYLHFSPIP